MDIAPSLVHPDQAGFMKGREIEDQVKLAKFLETITIRFKPRTVQMDMAE